jgi:hypothetical protein
MKMQELRQTGRSTRMLLEAEKLSRDGGYCFVIAGSQLERDRLRRKFLKLFSGCRDAGPNKVYTPTGQVSFEAIADVDLDWNLLRPMACHNSCAVLIDHWVFEKTYGHILKELHRFDS